MAVPREASVVRPMVTRQGYEGNALSLHDAGRSFKLGDRMTFEGKEIKPKEAGKPLVWKQEDNPGLRRLSALSANLGSLPQFPSPSP